MRIEHQETLETEFSRGMNLFLGAGFSIYAKNAEKELLPVGSVLCSELVKHFGCPDIADLSKVCTIIDSYNSDGLRQFLINRFQVAEFDPVYMNILKINAPRIFTTNIDDLPERIFEKSRGKYLNNIFLNGACFNDKNCIDFIPLHGTVANHESKFLFNMQEVSSSFRSQRNAWSNLHHSATQIPSLFLGYSLNDVGAIESLFGDPGGISTQKSKWILLHKEDPGYEAYYKALGFKIIVADIKEFLGYLGRITANSIESKPVSEDCITEIFPESQVPKGLGKIRVREIDEFFLGDGPIWSDIISNRVYSTSHLDHISNLVAGKKDVVVTGIPASGKSTLLLQLARKLSLTQRVLIFSDININKTNIIRNEIKSSTIILIDNFTNDIDAFLNLKHNPHIKLVGFDRYYNVDISGHKLGNSSFSFYDVSDLNPIDIQGIYNSIPLSLRISPMKSKVDQYEVPSIFEIVNYNIKKIRIADRYKPTLIDLEKNDPILLELLVMACYLHSCRTPVSFEVANSFLFDDVSSYSEVIETMKALKGMVQETLGSIVDEDVDQDYYEPRSQILAETILAQTSVAVFKRVFAKFHQNVPQHLIPNFYIFKRYAYDASHALRAFSNWNEGLEFYESIYSKDKTPFVLQQCSIYLLRKSRFSDAALQIDRALQISTKRYFSIENTHAIILFKANINSDSPDGKIRGTLDKSMQILKACYNGDLRKAYHASTFAEQALAYYSRFPDDQAIEYIKIAKAWLKASQVEGRNISRAKDLLREIEKLL
jgi:hypothetical protein